MSKGRGRQIFRSPAQRDPAGAPVTVDLQQAVDLHQRGHLADAEHLYRNILKRMPNQFDALHLLGVIEAQRGRYEEAAGLISKALKINAQSAAALSNLGYALRGLQRHEAALASYDRALAIKADYADALYHRGNTLRDLGRDENALTSYDQALAIKPNYPEALYNRGNALLNLKQYEAALASYDRALAIRPDHVEALNNRGAALQSLERYEDALASYDRALAIKRDYAEALNNRGNVLLNLRQHEDALASYDRALAVKPDYAEALNNRGNVLQDLDRHEDALVSYERALSIKPDYAEALYNRGNALRNLKRQEEALASYDRALAVKADYTEAFNNRGNALRDLGRFRDALTSYDCALALTPDDAEALYNRGNVLQNLERYEDALDSYDRALAIRPASADALSNRGNALMTLRRYQQAIEDFERVLSVNPEYPYARGKLLHSRMRCCDWTLFDSEILGVAADVQGGKRSTMPFEFVCVSDSAGDQLRCSQIWIKSECPQPSIPLWQGERYRHDKICVAYLSADFHDHATSYLLAGLFEHHDRSRFETIAVSYGPDDRGAMRTRLKNAFARFINVRDKGDLQVACLLRELEVDIAIDLKGFTGDSRPTILAFRPAPVQVNYLGYPGTMGADFIDYIIADRILIPEEQRQHYSEKVIYLPETYMGNDSKRGIAERIPSRAELGLPETGFVFCSFNNSYKITPAVFDVWMRLLRRAEGSVLWLLGTNAGATNSLKHEAEGRGIRSDRLIFAPHMKLDEHLARHRLADLFLDTVPCNAHTTASDSLWAGLPVVTCAGSTFAGRVAASLLTALGLPELITSSLQDYEALALKLAWDCNALAAIKAKLARNREIYPLFDTDRFRRHIEAAYVTMWERHQRGEPPASFAIAPIDH